jgi:hypothetical protein
MTTTIENRAQWTAYFIARERARAAGACRPCSQRIALAAVKTSAKEPDEQPELCAQCARLNNERKTA